MTRYQNGSKVRFGKQPLIAGESIRALLVSFLSIACLESRSLGQEPHEFGFAPALPNGMPTVFVPNERGSTEVPSEKMAEPPKEKQADLDSLLDMADKDPSQLQSVQVQNSHSASSINDLAETHFDASRTNSGASNSTGELLSQAPSVIIRRTSAVNQDVRLRGYSGSQIVGVANGMNQGKARLDIDSLFSQLDPSLIDSVSVIAGPYSVQYGPGFAFFDANLIQPGRSASPTMDSRSIFGFNSNGRQLSYRETAKYSSSKSGAIVSLGQRVGNDYRAGSNFGDFRIPASYDVYDLYTAFSLDRSEYTRLDVSYLYQGMQNVELPGVAYDINDQVSNQFNFKWTVKDDFQTDR